MADKKRLFENIVHGIFLILGLVTVACVLVKIGRASCRERV